MTSPLDGAIKNLFGAVIGGQLPRGWLYRYVLASDGKGGLTRAPLTPVQVRAQRNRLTEELRSGGDYTEADVGILIMQRGVNGTVSTDDEIVLQGARWSIRQVTQDPASAYWHCRGAEIRDGSSGGTTGTDTGGST